MSWLISDHSWIIRFKGTSTRQQNSLGGTPFLPGVHGNTIPVTLPYDSAFNPPVSVAVNFLLLQQERSHLRPQVCQPFLDLFLCFRECL